MLAGDGKVEHTTRSWRMPEGLVDSKRLFPFLGNSLSLGCGALLLASVPERPEAGDEYTVELVLEMQCRDEEAALTQLARSSNCRSVSCMSSGRPSFHRWPESSVESFVT